MCVIPTGLRWRRERQIMSQLENLANRMHMSAAHNAGVPSALSPVAASAALTRINDSMRRRSASRKRRLSQSSGYDNPAFIPITGQPPSKHHHHQPQITLPIFPYMYGMYPSQNEFNASIFGLDPSHLIGAMPPIHGKYDSITFILTSSQHNFYHFDQTASKRTQSLLDFRHIIPSMPPPPPSAASNKPSDLDQTDSSASHSFNNHQNKSEAKRSSRQNTLTKNNNKNDDERQSLAGDPIYHTISSEKGTVKALGRNCISLENLRTLTIKNDLNNYGNNLLQNNDSSCGGPPSSGYYILPSFPPPPPTSYHHYFSHKVPPYMFAPPVHHAPMPQQYFQPNYRMAPFTNYGGYANPNPYLSNTNSRQSIGNESDDYRKYRDVAL